METVAQSHLRLVVEIVPDHEFFEVLCLYDGRVGRVTPTAYHVSQERDKAPSFDLLSPLAITLYAVFWAFATGIALSVIRITDLMTATYQGVGLDLYSHSLLLTILMALQLAALPPLLFGYLTYLLRKVGVRMNPAAGLSISALVWVPATIALGVYPAGLQALVDANAPWRLEFQARFLSYRTATSGTLVVETDVIIVSTVALLTLGLAVWIAKVSGKFGVEWGDWFLLVCICCMIMLGLLAVALVFYWLGQFVASNYGTLLQIAKLGVVILLPLLVVVAVLIRAPFWAPRVWRVIKRVDAAVMSRATRLVDRMWPPRGHR